MRLYDGIQKLYLTRDFLPAVLNPANSIHHCSFPYLFPQRQLRPNLIN